MVKTIHWKTDYCNTVYKQEKTQPSHTSALHNTEKKLLTELKMFFKNNHLAPVNSWKINQLQDSFLEESPHTDEKLLEVQGMMERVKVKAGKENKLGRHHCFSKSHKNNMRAGVYRVRKDVMNPNLF